MVSILVFRNFYVRPTQRLTRAIQIRKRVQSYLLNERKHPTFALNNNSIFLLYIFRSRPPFRHPTQRETRGYFQFNEP